MSPHGLCRYCDQAAWLSDAAGPVHPCCVRFHDGRSCQSCDASRAHHAKGRK